MGSRYTALHCLLAILPAGWATCARAQSDTVALGTVEVTDTSVPLVAKGIYCPMADSASRADHASDDLGDLLADENISVKSYGLSGTATVSMRGTEARHTAVRWNGFDINSPSLGLSDVRLVPVSFSDQYATVYGPAASFGTTAIGGSLLMNYVPAADRGVTARLQAETGDFGHALLIPSVDWSGGRVASSTRLLWERSDNDYPYTNETRPGSPVENQAHARLRHTGLVQYLHARLPRRLALTAGCWYQVTDRQVPPLMTIPHSGAEQEDSVLRAFIALDKDFRNASLDVRAAWFDERQHYADTVYRIDARYHIKSYHAHALYARKLSSKISARAGFFFAHFAPRIAEYADATTDDRTSAFLEATWQSGRLALRGTVRQAWRHGDVAPPAPSAGIEYRLWKERLKLFASAGRYYSFPSMNDLYWQPGGDADLSPESAWAGQAGYRLTPGPWLDWEQGAYAMRISNWIQWQPVSAGYYAAQNIDEVFARGLEQSLRFHFHIRSWRVGLTGRYDYTLSTHEGDDAAYGSDGYQLIYIPRHSAAVSAHVRRGVFSCRVAWRYTGERYTTPDHSRALPAYGLADATVRLQFTGGLLRFEPYLSVRNLGDTAYQVIPFRPEPGLYFRFGLVIQYKNVKTI